MSNFETEIFEAVNRSLNRCRQTLYKYYKDIDDCYPKEKQDYAEIMLELRNIACVLGPLSKTISDSNPCSGYVITNRDSENG